MPVTYDSLAVEFVDDVIHQLAEAELFGAITELQSLIRDSETAMDQCLSDVQAGIREPFPGYAFQSLGFESERDFLRWIEPFAALDGGVSLVRLPTRERPIAGLGFRMADSLIGPTEWLRSFLTAIAPDNNFQPLVPWNVMHSVHVLFLVGVMPDLCAEQSNETLRDLQCRLRFGDENDEDMERASQDSGSRQRGFVDLVRHVNETWGLMDHVGMNPEVLQSPESIVRSDVRVPIELVCPAIRAVDDDACGNTRPLLMQFGGI